MNRKRELALVSLLSILIGLVTAALQPRWDDQALKWDAVSYLSMATQFASGNVPSELAPFVYRFGFPALAAAINPASPIDVMFWISMVSGLFAVVLMWFWLSQFAMLLGVRIALVLAFSFQFHGPVRLGIFYPTLTYSLFWVFLLAGLILLRRACRLAHPSVSLYLGTLIVVFLGTLVRETMLIVPVVMLIALLSSRRRLRRSVRNGSFVLILMCVSMSALAIALTRRLATQTNEYDFLSIAVDWASSKSTLELLAALFLTFGPMRAVIAAGPRETLSFWQSHPDVWVLIAVTTVLAVIGGTNTEIFWYWSAPAVLATVGVVLTNKRQVLLRPIMIIALVFAQLIAQRVFWAMPLEIESSELPTVLLSPLADATYLQLWSNFLAPRTQLEIILTNVAFVGLYVAASKWLMSRTCNRNTASPGNESLRAD